MNCQGVFYSVMKKMCFHCLETWSCLKTKKQTCFLQKCKSQTNHGGDEGYGKNMVC